MKTALLLVASLAFVHPALAESLKAADSIVVSQDPYRSVEIYAYDKNGDPALASLLHMVFIRPLKTPPEFNAYRYFMGIDCKRQIFKVKRMSVNGGPMVELNNDWQTVSVGGVTEPDTWFKHVCP
ncbi:MAG: hypothetical protein ACD_55C00094G0005 [uncultured bacterium]|uniref:hypothetical protein n=1 Tax=Citrifermentans bemidjiense TaxID=225194 RepID=UPI00017BFAA3|nr:hypothetical protein [Citrifermentans bemidjiense]EKD59269.1 MAG: hypothetical protein ACD_55C00094G0005 [uncultured bacterium]